jgi:ribosomal protein S12 methylthiotransferase accessory factor
METIEVTFPGGKRVDARVGPYVVHTDQPADAGGEGSAVAPFDLFLASLATCTGIYVLGFCQARGIPTDGIGLRQLVEVDPATNLPRRIVLELGLPPSFPEKYRPAILRAAAGCKVKKTIAAAPVIDVVLAAGGTPLAHAS